MANFNESYKINMELEFSSNPKKFLHKNKTEETITLGGIYRKSHPNALDWQFVDNIIKACETNVIHIDDSTKEQQDKEDLERASVLLYADEKTNFDVFKFFKNEFWLGNKLDEVHYQKTANRIFLMGINAGNRTAIKLAQKVSFAQVDGIVGPLTVRCLNNMQERDFIKQYDEACKEHYDNIIANKPHLAIYRNGWFARFDKINSIENNNMLFA